MCVRTVVALLSLALIFLPIGSAHVWNHENKGELCGVAPGEYGPHGHDEADGHAHWHHTGPATSAHHHGTTLMAAGHTHSAVTHDPCLQVRMKYPDYLSYATIPLEEVDPPTEEIDPLATLFPADDPNRSRVYVAGGEAYEFPVATNQWKVQTSFAITSDLQAAGMGLPGDGSPGNPYVIEGYIIKGNLLVKNTSKCFVIKNNVVVNRVIPGSVIPDPGSIISLKPLIPIWEAAIQAAEDLRAQVDAEKLLEDAEQAARDALLADWNADLADWNAEKSTWNAQAAQWQATWNAYAAEYFDMVQETEFLASDFEAYASQYQNVVQPAKGHSPYVDYALETVTDLDGVRAAFEPYQQDGTLPANDNVEGWINANPPPAQPPADWWGSAQAWQYEVQNYQDYQQHIVDLINSYWNDVIAGAPDDAAYQQFLADHAAFQAAYSQFVADYNAFKAVYDSETALYQQFLQHHQNVYATTGVDIQQAQAKLAEAAAFDFKYVGQLGTKLFNTADQLLQWAIKLLLGLLDPLDPNNVAQNTGQLILDWNGQCVHAYNNVVHDLRVNQNNDRTGFATGGIIENNRFYTIGQIRHYDGIFRDNEVGNRAFLHQLVKPSVTPAAATGRSINNDGANQGWYYDNVIYGNVDLDFHGHHHSAGFFAPKSHYHGSTTTVSYMRTATGCTATYDTPDPAKREGPAWDHRTDNDIEVFDMTVVEKADNENCLPHFDHAKRWTSVFFNDNIVIDPNGVGLRFEDRDHRADDEQANSENLRELKRPHYHQKWVQLEDNTIVGKIFVDVLNAAGTNLWTDDWSAVGSASGTGRVQESLNHPGAEIVTSHPYRNDAWLDIQRNNILQTQSAGVLVADAADLTLFQLKDNRAFAFPKDYTTTKTPMEMLAWIKGVAGRSTTEVWDDIKALGGADRGVQTFAHLAFLRNQFTVEHCNNIGRGLDRGLAATDRIYDDQQSIIQACGTSDYQGANPAVDIAYTPMPTGGLRCTEKMREYMGDTDDFYASETVFDVLDGLKPAAVCEQLEVPAPRPSEETVSDPAGFVAQTVQKVQAKLGL
jgi:hypothetical protein